MAKPAREVEDKNYFKDIHFLYLVLNELKSLEEVKNFLKDILTTSELRMVKRRWHIARLLEEGADIRAVAQESKTSTQTVSKIKRVLEEGNGGLKNAVEKMNEKIKKEKEQLKKSKNRQGSKYVKNWFK